MVALAFVQAGMHGDLPRCAADTGDGDLLIQFPNPSGRDDCRSTGLAPNRRPLRGLMITTLDDPSHRRHLG
jgi:hypothetical protein